MHRGMLFGGFVLRFIGWGILPGAVFGAVTMLIQILIVNATDPTGPDFAEMLAWLPFYVVGALVIGAWGGAILGAIEGIIVGLVTITAADQLENPRVLLNPIRLLTGILTCVFMIMRIPFVGVLTRVPPLNNFILYATVQFMVITFFAALVSMYGAHRVAVWYIAQIQPHTSFADA
jgi:hypothetical protein